MGEVLLFDSHVPALQDGIYEISVKQSFHPGSSASYDATTTSSFEVAGEQYELGPQLVDSVFPPVHARGNFAAVLPHIILNRGTLPWERQPCVAAGIDLPAMPWMALLLLTEDELSTANSPADMKDSNGFYAMSMTREAWEQNTVPWAAPMPADKDKPLVSCIFTGKDNKLLKVLLPATGTDDAPRYTETAYLAHVRGGTGEEKALIVGGRMPVKNKRNIVHLVSLEGDGNQQKIFKQGDTAYYGFASLQSWEFFCTDQYIMTREIVAQFSKLTQSIPPPDNIAAADVQHALETLQPDTVYFSDTDFLAALNRALQKITAGGVLLDPGSAYVVKALLPVFEVAHLNHILKHLSRAAKTPGSDLAGHWFLALDYKLKDGDRIPALYRGPLMPVGTRAEPLSFTAPLSSDDLLLFFGSGDAEKVNVSYASAWELGRLLALKDKNFSVALFQWKRSCYQVHKSRDHETIFPPMPAFVRTWFDDLLLLGNVPFSYLVPAEAYLPAESIRFFTIDESWIRCLADGAFSIGRISTNDATIDLAIAVAHKPYVLSAGALLETRAVSGFLLRSRAVSGWPDMVVEGTANDEPAGLFRKNLSADVLLCQFDKAVDKVRLYQKPESVHFGFEEDDEGEGLHLKYPAGQAQGQEAVMEPVEVVVDCGNGKVAIARLYDDLKAKAPDQASFSTAAFAALLVQKIEPVSFRLPVGEAG